MADGGSGRRGLKVRVRTAKRRSASSARWLERQLNDPYVARAQGESRRARSAYKLIEIDDRFRLLRPGRRVVDLGAAPGGWSEVAAERVGSTDTKPLVVAVDMLGMAPISGVSVLRSDFLEPTTTAAIRAALPGGAADVVLSDLAAPTTGHRRTDQLRTAHLAEAAADFAMSVLAAGGDLVAKVFSGGGERELLTRLKRAFVRVGHVKPPASRPESRELYLVARGFRGDAV